MTRAKIILVWESLAMVAAAFQVVSLGLAVGIGRPVLLSSHTAPTRWSPLAIPAMVLKAGPETSMRLMEPERSMNSEEKPQSPQTEEDAGSVPSPSDSTSDGLVEGRLLMLLVACLWGTNFPAVKAILEAGLSPSLAAAARFGLAALALSPLLKQGPKLERELVIGGLECGAWLALGYIAQALALMDTPSAVVAFIASLQVVLVPLTLAALGKGTLSPRLVLSCALCVGGVGLLELGPVLAGMLSGAPTGDAAAGAASLGATATPGRVSRDLLARLLQRTPPAQVPKLGLDLVLDEPAPFTAELAQVIRVQARPLLVAGFFGSTRSQVRILSPRLTSHQPGPSSGLKTGSKIRPIQAGSVRGCQGRPP